MVSFAVCASPPVNVITIYFPAIETVGNPGWNWAGFLKYMKKVRYLAVTGTRINEIVHGQAETTMPLSPEVRPEYGITTTQSAEWHGNSGPVVKSYPTNFNALHTHITDALETLGVPKNPEPVRSHAGTLCFMHVVSLDVQSGGINVGSVTTFAAVDPRTATRSYSANVSSICLWAGVYAS